MNAKKQFLKYLASVILAFVSMLLLFWWSGASVLPFGERDFVGNARMIKPWIIYDETPSELLITNSRGLYGYDLSSFVNSDPYNFSLTGVGAYEISRMVKHAYFAGGENSTFYVGIDTICGEVKPSLDGTFYNDDYLLTQPNWLFNGKRIKSLVSSPADIIRRKIINKPGVDKYGFQASFPDENYVNGGIFQSLQAREKMDYKEFEFESDCDTSAFKDLLNFLYLREVKFILFLNPKHVRTYIAYQTKDQLDQYFVMLKEYVEINNQVAKKYDADASQVKFFAEVNEFTSEKFPTNGDVFDPMKYWYENSHFKSSLGKIVLKSLLSDESDKLLTSKNVESKINELRQNIKEYILNNQDVKYSVENAVRKASSDE